MKAKAWIQKISFEGGRKMRFPKPYYVFFLIKRTSQSKSCCLFSLLAAQIKTKINFRYENIKTHNDNVRLLIHFSVKNYLKCKKQLIKIAWLLSEFWLFGCIKERLTSNQDAKSLMKQITGVANFISKQEWNKRHFKSG